jgi:hypothetical protein
MPLKIKEEAMFVPWERYNKMFVGLVYYKHAYGSTSGFLGG